MNGVGKLRLKEHFLMFLKKLKHRDLLGIPQSRLETDESFLFYFYFYLFIYRKTGNFIQNLKKQVYFGENLALRNKNYLQSKQRNQ